MMTFSGNGVIYSFLSNEKKSLFLAQEMKQAFMHKYQKIFFNLSNTD